MRLLRVQKTIKTYLILGRLIIFADILSQPDNLFWIVQLFVHVSSP